MNHFAFVRSGTAAGFVLPSRRNIFSGIDTKASVRQMTSRMAMVLYLPPALVM